ncbi:Set domain-containing hypothetical protein [Phytophthora megakarya]|uniref:SET domain-containing protein n=1 Tax=Phytophthora megakarya TaxID=4795 RepID=A0A225V1B9_9STRA|nr:Set domain-containing hypothetical protein [Phytophthora megakarya]
MPGLAASQLPVEALSAGDTIEYYSRAFVCGDKRGHRSAVVVRIDPEDDLYPVQLNTEELLPLDNLMRRTADQYGKATHPSAAKWRKLRTYKLLAGTFSAPVRSSTLNTALAAIVRGACASAHHSRASRREGFAPTATQPEEVAAEDVLAPSTIAAVSSTSAADDEAYSCSRGDDEGHTGPDRTEGIAVPPTISESDQDSDSAQILDAGPAHTDNELLDAKEYLRSHQKKRRAGEWHVSRSRKRRDQRKCAVARSGQQIHHAHTVTALKMKQLLVLPAVRLRFVDLHERRKTYAPPVHDGRFSYAEVPWPATVQRVEACVSNGIKFPNIGDLGRCRCEGDGFIDTCENAAAAVYCTGSCCNLGALCSNAPRVRDTLQLFDTRWVGLSVYTTADMDVGDIVGEYAGELSEYDAVVPGQLPVAVKQNSGYTLLMNTKSVRKKFVYVDALQCGSVTRFLVHSCTPNAALVELQNGPNVKVLERMLKDVRAGAQITVHYGDETWFTCMCEQGGRVLLKMRGKTVLRRL